ncbi:DUF5684 domain-containing protein [Mariniphaga sediminis]|jgi:hypothetical protein|nr:DUF5684 domain-containing protein [Mariniphaga sediminis]
MNQILNFVLLGFIGPQEIIIIFIMLFLILIPLIAMWKLFEKANQPGWAAIIPIYNLIVFMEIIGKPWWWIFLWMIPSLNFIWIIWGWNLMVKSFGKSEGFTVGVILLSIIFIPILGFGDSKYIGPAGLKQ